MFTGTSDCNVLQCKYCIAGKVCWTYILQFCANRAKFNVCRITFAGVGVSC